MFGTRELYKHIVKPSHLLNHNKTKDQKNFQIKTMTVKRPYSSLQRVPKFDLACYGNVHRSSLPHSHIASTKHGCTSFIEHDKNTK